MKIEVSCDHCGISYERVYKSWVVENFCSRKCKSDAKHVEGPCGNCGVPVRRLRCETKNASVLMCSRACLNEWNSKRFTGLNIALNPDRMTPSTRKKLREHRLGTGEGKTYTKTYSRHTHRIVAEQKLGRPLAPGEVVHHIDENKRNNHPDNLQVFASQVEHAKHHIENLNKIKKLKSRAKKINEQIKSLQLSRKVRITYLE